MAEKRRIHSDTSKKLALRSCRPGPRRKDIHDIRTWPPGTFMVYDSRAHVAPLRGFVGLGIVVVNDGIDRIRVFWGANCHEPWVEYHASTLNRAVISCVE